MNNGKKVLILSGSQNYAASVSSTTASTATDLTILNTGAVAFYGLVDVDSGGDTNDNRYTLITPTDLSTNGKISAANFLSGGGYLVTLLQGYPTYPIKSGDIQTKGVTKVLKQSYLAPVKQVSFIGYNGSTGSLNLPTIAAYDEATLLAVQQEVTTPDQIREQEQYGTAPLLASTTAYDIMLQLINSINNTTNKTQTAFITSNGTQADFTGTATTLLFTKGSKTVAFMIQDATSGWVASTGTVAKGDLIGVANQSMVSVVFTAGALGSSAGHYVVSVGSAIYVVADAGSAAQNATAIAAAVNAGGLATAVTSGTSDVTITCTRATYSTKILVVHSNDDSAWTTDTLTVTSTGEAVGMRYKAAADASAAATFTLDTEYQGETGYFLGGTDLALTTGIVTTQTEYGMKLIIDTVALVYQYAKQGVIQLADITYTVGASQGFGTGDILVKIEEGLIAYRGQFDQYSKWYKQLPRFAVAATNYDAYTIQYRNTTVESGFDNNKGDNSTMQIYMPSGFAGQANFETVIKALFANAIVNF